jgi:hypothetical protein
MLMPETLPRKTRIMTEQNPQTTIDCYKCGQILLDNLPERTIGELHTAAKNHACHRDCTPNPLGNPCAAHGIPNPPEVT